MARSRDITVQRDGEEVGRQTLELLRMPDGAAGAKWGGLVFPLRDDDRIELIDRAIPPGQCAPWEEQRASWSLSAELPVTGAYLYIEGSAQTCVRTVRKLEEAGIRVLRSGPNLSGNLGDWFIRLDAPVDGDREKISNILADGTQVAAADDGASLRERLLVQALAITQASQARLRSELDQIHHAVVALPAVADDERILRRNLEEISVRLAEAQAEAEELRARIAATPRPTPKPSRLETELAAAAEGMLPRVDFVGDSLSFIAVELPSRAILWKALSALDRQERGQPVGWKSLAGHSGWWERHFSTGQDNQGRIYARLTGQPARWQVLVSHKQDQPEDLRRIARM